MNQYEFYSNFFKYRSNKEDLQHSSTYGDYYHKIDNYYGPGKSRYFKTKEEYDAHLMEQRRLLEKAREDVNTKNTQIAQSGREAAIKNSSNWKDSYIRDEAKKINETAKQLQGSSSSNAQGVGKDYQNYLNKGYSDTLPGAQRAKKEKENAEKAAERSKLLKAAQSGREAAINNSYKMSDEEIQEAFDKDKKWQEEQKKLKNNKIYSVMKSIQNSVQKRIERGENLQNQQRGRQAAINNSEKISDEEWKKRLKEDEEWQKIAKKPGGKIIADALVMNKKVLNSEKERQAQLDKLDRNFNEVKGILQKLKSNNGSITESQLSEIRNNPLYGALNWSLSNGDASYDIMDVIMVGGKASESRINQIEKNLNDFVSALEDTINESEIKKPTKTTVAENKTETKEQPRPHRGAI